MALRSFCCVSHNLRYSVMGRPFRHSREGTFEGSSEQRRGKRRRKEKNREKWKEKGRKNRNKIVLRNNKEKLNI
jgi:hypothetical protein